MLIPNLSMIPVKHLQYNNMYNTSQVRFKLLLSLILGGGSHLQVGNRPVTLTQQKTGDWHNHSSMKHGEKVALIL